MGFNLRVDGHRNLSSVRQALREVGDKGLGRQMGQALKRAAEPLGKAVQAETKVLPSGYAPLMSRSLRWRMAVRSQRDSAHVEWRVHADGQRERRDLPAVNRGVLRHPVWGRRRSPWVAQRVRSGVVDRPVDRLMPDVTREMQRVVDWVGDQIKRG